MWIERDGERGGRKIGMDRCRQEEWNEKGEREWVRVGEEPRRDKERDGETEEGE